MFWPNIIFIIALAGAILMVLRRLPQAARLERREQAKGNLVAQRLSAKGLELGGVSRLRTWLQLQLKRIWHFFLEAKDIKHTPQVSYQIKKMFSRKPSIKVDVKPQLNGTQVQSQRDDAPVQDEQYFLRRIQNNPDSLLDYSALGQYYLSKKQFLEAEKIFVHLVGKEPGSPNYLARLAYCQLFLADYPDAIANYERSLRFDPAHPNRFYNLSIAQRAMGQNEEAADALRKALDMEPDNLKYQQALSEVS